MASYTGIDDVADTLLGVLRGNMGELIAADHITSRSPADVSADELPQLSLFLYQVVENRYLKNQDAIVIDAQSRSFPPLALQLSFLLSAHARTAETEFLLMGKAMQVLYDNATIGGSVLKGSLSDDALELTVVPQLLSIDDLNKLWTLFGNKSYKLSAGYLVSSLLIESTRSERTDRVTERTFRFTND